MGQTFWQKNIHCKQGLQRNIKESIGVWQIQLTEKEKKIRKKRDIWIYEGNAVCGYVDLTPPVIRTSNEPRACTCRSFGSAAVHGWSHIEHR